MLDRRNNFISEQIDVTTFPQTFRPALESLRMILIIAALRHPRRDRRLVMSRMTWLWLLPRMFPQAATADRMSS